VAADGGIERTAVSAAGAWPHLVGEADLQLRLLEGVVPDRDPPQSRLEAMAAVQRTTSVRINALRARALLAATSTPFT